MSQQAAIDVPVLVVGAGPTGLMMACEIARRGIRCRIIDKSPHAADLSKALAIHARTLEVFENVGIVDRFVSAGVKAHGGSVYADGKRILHFSFDNLASRYNFALMLPQDETEALLGKHLESLRVKVERSVELTSLAQTADAVVVTLKHPDGHEEQCRTEYLIGCDGAHSTVRHALNLGFDGEEYEEHFALADIRVDSSMPDDEICGFASEKGIVFFFPITHGRYRLIADVDAQRPDGEPTIEDLQKIVDEQCHIQARLHDPKWMAYFKIHRRQASAYRAGRAFVVGDAAHIHSPAGGQGMNTGLQDAYNLAWKLALTMKGLAKPAVLDSYGTERHAVGRAVLKLTDTMTRAMELRNPVGAGIRNRIAAVLSSSDMFRSFAARNMAELEVNYRESPIVGEYHEGLFASIASYGGGPRAGDRAPDAEGLRLRDGKSARLHELLRRDEHKVLLFGGARAGASEYAALASTAKQIADKYKDNVRTYIVAGGNEPDATAGWNGDAIIDSADTLHRAYHAVSSCAYVIRPDGYIAYRSFPANAARLMEYLGRIFV
ncbi:MAG: FAD-dependent monooxygenase [Candidatus Binataceae bacterium]